MLTPVWAECLLRLSKMGVCLVLEATSGRRETLARPYLLGLDIKASVAAAAEAEITMPPTAITGYGQFAIVVIDGIESRLWQS